MKEDEIIYVKKKFKDGFDDVKAAFYEETRELYHETGYKYKKYDPERCSNNRLQESWWNNQDESEHMNRIIQTAEEGYDAIHSVGSELFDKLGDAQ